MNQNALTEAAKLQVRKVLHRANLSVGRDPAIRRVVRALHSIEVTSVIDVGANVGQFAALLRSAGFTGRIVSFEPLTEAFQRLEKRARKDVQWETKKLAVGDRSGLRSIHVSQNSYSSSLLPIKERHLAAAPASRTVGAERVSVRPLHELATELGITPARTFLKVDTQGFENQVLNGARDLVHQFAAIQLELSFVGLYEGQELFDALCRRMSDAGLTLYSIEPGVSDRHGRLLQCDGLFLRTEMIPGG